MKINDHIIGSDAGTGEWYVDTPDNPFETLPQAEWFAMSGESVSEQQAIKELTMAQSQAQYIEAVRTENRNLWNAINNLVELQKQWNALDYGTTLVDTVYGQPTTDYGSVVFDTTTAMVAVQTAGHATNMAKLL